MSGRLFHIKMYDESFSRDAVLGAICGLGAQLAGGQMQKEFKKEHTEGSTRVSEYAYQYLRSQIFESKIAPGELITERRLAIALGVSRTPLRAAISRLEGEGIIERLPNGCMVIHSVSVEELLDILFVRRMLEPEAAALACGRIQTETLHRLECAARAFTLGNSVEHEEFWQHDDDFHTAIACGSGKSILAATISELRQRARMCHLARMPKTFKEQGQEHLVILRSLGSGSPDEAREAMTVHLQNVQRRITTWLCG